MMYISLFRRFRWLLGILAITLSFTIYASSAIALELPTSPNITSLAPAGSPEVGKGWVVTSRSGNSELTLAAHLQKTGAKLYGAWWCPHCYEQKQLFGQEAVQASFESLAIECAEDGLNNQIERCRQQEIQGFPTWIIKGQKYPGVQSPAKLAELSGYNGSKDFLYAQLSPDFLSK
jgi:hypothetical protein